MSLRGWEAQAAGAGRSARHEVFQSELNGTGEAPAGCFVLLRRAGRSGSVKRGVSRKCSLEDGCCIVKTLDII